MIVPQRRQYAHPPIQEALCEFKFEPAEWDPTLPGRFQAAVTERYPGKPREQQLVTARFVVFPGQPLPQVTPQQRPVRVQFTSEDGKRVLSVGPDAVSAHRLAPYTSWEDFRPDIERALEDFRAVAKPKQLTRVGVRYVNRIVIPKVPIELDHYFRHLASIDADGLPSRVVGFVFREERVFDDGVKLVVTHATQPSTDESRCEFLLDIDVAWEASEPRPIDSAMDLADDLRNRERAAFEALITDETRRLFDGVQ
jgi:uncharacterized protein (TIGR04255 family)